MDDEAEASRYQDTVGVGEMSLVTDEEIKTYAMDQFGLDVDFDSGLKS